MEHDPTAVEPGELADPSEAIKGSPPSGFEPQPDLGPDQTPELVEREPDLIKETEAADPDRQSNDDGEADDGDDAVDEGDDN